MHPGRWSGIFAYLGGPGREPPQKLGRWIDRFLKDEESGPLKGKMKDNGLIDFTYEAPGDIWKLQSSGYRSRRFSSATCPMQLSPCKLQPRGGLFLSEQVHLYYEPQ